MIPKLKNNQFSLYVKLKFVRKDTPPLFVLISTSLISTNNDNVLYVFINGVGDDFANHTLAELADKKGIEANFSLKCFR